MVLHYSIHKNITSGLINAITQSLTLCIPEMPLMDVSRRLGHAKPSHALDLYGHAMPGQDDQIANQIAEIYNLANKKQQPLEESAEKFEEK